MEIALFHPEDGYYVRRDPLGRRGDFITAPEISQSFGELIGLWCAEIWGAMGRPDPVRLVELGPGRGTLMADALRAVARAAPEFRAALDIHLVEASPALRRIQGETLADAAPAWHERFESVPAGPCLIVANEFFDALPIHQMERTKTGWRERLVALDGSGFRFVLAGKSGALEDAIADTVRGAPPGAVAELCPAGEALAASIGERLAGAGGAALIVDYGHGSSAAGDTLQAVRGHEYAGVLAAPGAADLTAHVDFAALARAAMGVGARAHGPRTQGDFLGALGIEARAEALARGATKEKSDDIRAGIARLIDPAQMGSLFKVMAMTVPTLPAPPGFED